MHVINGFKVPLGNWNVLSRENVSQPSYCTFYFNNASRTWTWCSPDAEGSRTPARFPACTRSTFPQFSPCGSCESDSPQRVLWWPQSTGSASLCRPKLDHILGCKKGFGWSWTSNLLELTSLTRNLNLRTWPERNNPEKSKRWKLLHFRKVPKMLVKFKNQFSAKFCRKSAKFQQFWKKNLRLENGNGAKECIV